MAEPQEPGRPDGPPGRQREVGGLEVLRVAAIVVAVVLVAAAVGTFVPPVEAFFGQVPIAVAVLIGGTAWILWRVARRPGVG